MSNSIIHFRNLFQTQNPLEIIRNPSRNKHWALIAIAILHIFIMVWEKQQLFFFIRWKYMFEKNKHRSFTNSSIIIIYIRIFLIGFGYYLSNYFCEPFESIEPITANWFASRWYYWKIFYLQIRFWKLSNIQQF